MAADFSAARALAETRLVLLRPMNGVGKRDDYRAVRLSLLSDGWASEAGGYKECKYTPSKAKPDFGTSSPWRETRRPNLKAH